MPVPLSDPPMAVGFRGKISVQSRMHLPDFGIGSKMVQKLSPTAFGDSFFPNAKIFKELVCSSIARCPKWQKSS